MIPLRNNAPAQKLPFVNWGIILVNCYVFYRLAILRTAALQQHFINHWSLIPTVLWSHFSAQWFTLFTAMFLHAGWLHIISNMAFLFIFGGNVESAMGHGKYFLFYMLVGCIANATQAYVTPSGIPLLGASGAIAGVLGSFFFFYPHARVLTLIPFFILFTIREVPAYLFLGLWFVIQMFNGAAMLSSQLITKQSLGGVAWWAHAAGFISGILLTPLFGKKFTKFR